MATTGSGPLSDREIEELDDLLAAVPEAFDPLNVVMLDGFLVGAALQPEPVPLEALLPYVFDAEARAEAAPADAAVRQRVADLVARQFGYLAACLAARKGFDPIVFSIEDERGRPAEGKAGIAALAPWAAGFMGAIHTFPQLLDTHGEDSALAESLVGVLRHLPVDPDEPAAEARRFAEDKRRVERDMPLADLDDAIEHLIECVLDAADISRPRKPLARETPKVGRNDPCPCGSGRKYKQCHGAPN
ncbi:MAG: UPF0149 family protein [Burkholderiaceae bacterium]|nr:UPF0149 family protein [Burkholderiaceae bacterium]